MARAAAAFSGQPVRVIRKAVWAKPLQVRDRAVEVGTTWSAANGMVEIVTGRGPETVSHFQATVGGLSAAAEAPLAVGEIQARCLNVLSEAEAARLFAGQRFGDAGAASRFRTVTLFRHHGSEAVATLERIAESDGELDPGMLDGVLTVVHLHYALRSGQSATLVPFALQELRIFGPLPARAIVHARATSRTD